MKAAKNGKAILKSSLRNSPYRINLLNQVHSIHCTLKPKQLRAKC